MEHAELRDRTTALLDTLADRLPADRLADYRRFAFVGEWGELVDNLLAGLHKRRTQITEGERAELRAVLAAFPVPSGYRYIDRQAEIVPGLTTSEDG